MPTGGLAPCPLRLTGNDETGWRPESHAQCALDVATALQALPLAVMQIAVGATGSVTVQSLLSRAGTAITGLVVNWTPDDPPLTLTVTFPDTFQPPGATGHRQWIPRCGQYTLLGGNSTTISADVSSQTLTMAPIDSDVVVQLVVYGDVSPTDPHEYGFDREKEPSRTEGEAPYAYWELEGIREDRGSMFSSAASSLVEMENLALARHYALGRRLAERHAANQTPATSGQAIQRWTRLLAVQRGDDSEWGLRERCIRKMAFRATGANTVRLTDAIRALFTQNAGIVRHDGTLAAPPTPTYWPTINPGPAALNLGPGTWSSDRARFTIQISIPYLRILENSVYVANTELRTLLDGCLPAATTWDWSCAAASGFTLNSSILDWYSLL